MHRVSCLSLLALASLLPFGLAPLAASAGGAPSGGRAPTSAPASTGATRPTLSLPCTIKHETVTCTLAGRGFYPRERVQVTYNVRVGVGSTGDLRNSRRMVYRRTATANDGGSFMRPGLWFTLDPHNGAFGVEVSVTGAHGDRANYASGGGE